jgi:hypothetical protein
MNTPRYPNADHPSWNAFFEGYLAGIIVGIGMGRAQVSQERADAWTFPHRPPRTPTFEACMWASQGLSRAEVFQRQRAEYTERHTRRYRAPALSAEDIRVNAFRSWGLDRARRQVAA